MRDASRKGEATPRVSVVIPTRNRPQFLREALESLQRGDLRDFEALVMDQSDKDDTEAVVRGLSDPRLVYHRMPRQGACPARNFGAAIARASIVVFMDDDVHARPDWLSRIVGAFDADAKLQFIFGQLSAPPGRQTEGMYPYFLPTPEHRKSGNHRRVMKDAAGANMSARKEFLRRVGGFDELLGPANPGIAGNDASMIYKVLRSGEKWDVRADIDVVHVNGFRNWDQWQSLMSRYAHGSGVNYGRFIRRGSVHAIWYAFLQQWDMLKPVIKGVVTRGRPQNLRLWLWFLRGLWQGLKFPPRLGYADGAAIRRMESSGTCD